MINFLFGPKKCIQFLIFLAIRRIGAKTPLVGGLPLSQSRQASRTPFRNPRSLERKVVKELEKRQQKAKREFNVFKAARERAARSFFWFDAASTEETERRQIRRHECTNANDFTDARCGYLILGSQQRAFKDWTGVSKKQAFILITADKLLKTIYKQQTTKVQSINLYI